MSEKSLLLRRGAPHLVNLGAELEVQRGGGGVGGADAAAEEAGTHEHDEGGTHPEPDHRGHQVQPRPQHRFLLLHSRHLSTGVAETLYLRSAHSPFSTTAAAATTTAKTRLGCDQKHASRARGLASGMPKNENSDDRDRRENVGACLVPCHSPSPMLAADSTHRWAQNTRTVGSAS